MTRKLILTPYEHGFIAGTYRIYNSEPWGDKENPIDLTHILLSVVTMAGVDSIQSIGELRNTKTKLVKKILPEKSVRRWSVCYKKVSTIFEPYQRGDLNKDQKEALSDISDMIMRLFYAMQTNSGILLFNDLNKIANQELLPTEIRLPAEVLFNSIQKKEATLPILRYDVEKTDVKRLISILESKEFEAYKEAQSNIESNVTLTSKTLKSIERAGRDLYAKNIKYLHLKDSIVKAIPMSAKIIDLFMGKLPGILADYGSNLLTHFLKVNKTIPIYNCEAVLDDVFNTVLKRIMAHYKINLNRGAE